ncbi:MAG: DNA adenine methylase [Longimicrobiales bacterium]|nr:DNA adenine methylase [Longimicrobiales bacterium]
MRYIGNKTKLLGFIEQKLEAREITGEDLTAVDPFSGTASVAQHLKSLGFRVTASDIMAYGYVFARAYVEVTRLPDAPGLADEVLAVDGRDAPSARDVIDHLNGLDPVPGFIHRSYGPTGEAGKEHGRMYFTPENAARIDHVRNRVEEWRRADRIGDDLYHVLVAAVIEAADRVANTTGVYAAFVKSWQPNARRRLKLELPEIVEGNGCRAAQADAVELVADIEPFDLLYLDPPYNNRQYPGYYHIPELLAMGWFDGKPELRGKTGLVPDEDKRSDWSKVRKCEAAFEALIATAPWTHVVMSYNDEGIIPEPTIERVLKQYGRRATYKRYSRTYKRYRSDADRKNRRYKGDKVKEYLYCVSR